MGKTLFNLADAALAKSYTAAQLLLGNALTLPDRLNSAPQKIGICLCSELRFPK